MPLGADKVVDWHGLSFRIVAGDAPSGLSALPSEIRAAIEPAVHNSVAAGFGTVLAIGAVAAALSGILTWLLIRAAETRETVLEAKRV
jgi:hypothetical protein